MTRASLLFPQDPGARFTLIVCLDRPDLSSGVPEAAKALATRWRLTVNLPEEGLVGAELIRDAEIRRIAGRNMPHIHGSGAIAGEEDSTAVHRVLCT